MPRLITSQGWRLYRWRGRCWPPPLAFAELCWRCLRFDTIRRHARFSLALKRAELAEALRQPKSCQYSRSLLD